MTKKPSKPPTRAALAEALQVSPVRITQLRQAGMPAGTITEAKRWRDDQAGKHRTKSDSAEELRLRRIGLLKQQTRKAKLDADQTEGRLVSLADVETSIFTCTMAAKMALWSLIGTLPPSLAGLSEIPISRILEENFRRILDMLADGHPAFWKSEIGEKALAYLETLQAERAKLEKKTKP